MQRGFTLIELLVVVLIIGILSAIALPQYQKAVTKTRYTTMKTLARSLINAEEIYYLANNEYTGDMESLDVTAPQDPYISCHAATFADNKGVYVRCNHSQIQMGYQIYPYVSEHICLAYTDDASSVQAKVCKQETQVNGYPNSEGLVFYYQ